MERLNLILMDPFYQQCLDRNRIAEVDRKFCKHDFQHTIDVARITYMLCLESKSLAKFIDENNLEGTEELKEIIYTAAILHDIARWKQYESGGDHAKLGADMVGELLQKYSYQPGEIDIIISAIRQHRSLGSSPNLLDNNLNLADDLSRPCTQCTAKSGCYKFEEMETGKIMLIY